jgi:hypothetical protein
LKNPDSLSRTFAASANRRFEFKKCSPSSNRLC